MARKSLDILVMGATGFTGECTVKTLASLMKENFGDIAWGISGRSEEKMQNLKKKLDESDLNIKDVPMLKCDIQNQESLDEVLQETKIVINCTGPNVILSLPIVKACIKTGTHYIDISAETFQILTTYRDCNKAAEDASVLVIPACGFAVIPFESAMIYLERQFKGILHTVEGYNEIIVPKRAYLPGRTLVHNGTWTSTIYVMNTLKKHMALWKQMFPDTLNPEPEEMKRSFFHRHNGRTWFPYPGPDTIVADISQKNLFKKIQKKPAHIKIYTTMPKFFHFLIVPFMFLYYYLSYFGFFRKLLINFPGFFTLGYMTQKGPTEETRRDTKFDMVLNGKGWDLGANLSKPTKMMSIKVSGSDPGYDITAIAVVMCAITVLRDSSNMPKGGVVMPGEAFFETNIVERLSNNGFTFEVLSNQEK